MANRCGGGAATGLGNYDIMSEGRIKAGTKEVEDLIAEKVGG